MVALTTRPCRRRDRPRWQGSLLWQGGLLVLLTLRVARADTASCLLERPALRDDAACRAAEAAHGLVAAAEPRECLIARVPWRTPLSRVECCLHHCVRRWTRLLGLDRLAEAWAAVDNSTIAPGEVEAVALVAGRVRVHGISASWPRWRHDPSPPRNMPRLGRRRSLISAQVAGRRPALFAAARRKGAALEVLEDAMKERGLPAGRLPRGGALVTADQVGLQEYDDRIDTLLNTEPVSVVTSGDAPVDARIHERRPQPTVYVAVKRRVKRAAETDVWYKFPLSRGGGLFAQNLVTPEAARRARFGAVRQIPLPLKPKFFGELIRAEARPNPSRSDILRCCCMFDRNGREPRARTLQARGLCRDWKHISSRAVR